MGYSQITFGQLTAALSQRLSDPTFIFWHQPELQSYLIEALRTWQAHTQFYSIKAQITTSPGVFLYNLSSLIPQLTPTITDQQLIKDIELALQEPLDPTAWIGTEQFTFAAVVQAIQNRRDRFVLETGLAWKVSEVPWSPPPQSVLDIDDSIVDIRRMMWKNSGGIYSLLWKADQFAFMAESTNWFNSPGVPTDYSLVLEQPLSVQLSPPPADIGSVNMITVNSGPTLNPASGPTILGIPDDYCWIVKYGALADLYSTPGPGADSLRASYCETRWKDGIQLARISNFVKLGMQNGVPAFIDSMDELDAASPSWVSKIPGAPQSMAVSGNIAAVSPPPDSNGPYSLMFDITPKMIVPSVPGDFIQVGAEFVDVILDYAQHIAQVKLGIQELYESYQLYRNFAQIASVENDVLRANASDFDVLSDRTFRSAQEVTRRKSDINLMPLEVNPQ